MMKITPLKDNVDEGIDYDYFGVKLKIARHGNDNNAFTAKRDKLMLPFEDQELTFEQMQSIYAQAAAGTILVGWEPFEFEGKTVPYSIKTAVELLKNDSDLRFKVSEVSQNLDNYIDKKKVALRKKS